MCRCVHDTSQFIRHDTLYHLPYTIYTSLFVNNKISPARNVQTSSLFHSSTSSRASAFDSAKSNEINCCTLSSPASFICKEDSRWWRSSWRSRSYLRIKCDFMVSVSKRCLQKIWEKSAMLRRINSSKASLDSVLYR